MRFDDARSFAAKWRADGHADNEPTDDALRAAFAGCVLPPRPEHYPVIREAIHHDRHLGGTP